MLKSQTFAYPEAEIVITPSTAVLCHRTGGRGVSQVMVPTDKHQWNGGIGSPQSPL